MDEMGFLWLIELRVIAQAVRESTVAHEMRFGDERVSFSHCGGSGGCTYVQCGGCTYVQRGGCMY